MIIVQEKKLYLTHSKITFKRQPTLKAQEKLFLLKEKEDCLHGSVS